MEILIQEDNPNICKKPPDVKAQDAKLVYAFLWFQYPEKQKNIYQ